jgi:hypothetical protein
MAVSFAFSRLPYISDLSEGTRIIIITLLIAGAAAFIFPVEEKPESADSGGEDEI